MTEGFFVGVDQGSSSSKVVLLSGEGKILFRDTIAIRTTQFSPQEIEQDPREILQSVVELLDRAFRAAPERPRAIGIAAQSSSVTAWSESGLILHPLITWRDTRCRGDLPTLDELRARITKLSGLPVNPHYAATKYRYLQRMFPLEDAESTYVGTLDSFLLWSLSGGERFVCDHTMASRTQLYELNALRWSPELCEQFSADISRLPEVVPSYCSRGSWRGVPLMASIRDQQAGLVALMDSRNHVLTLGTIGSLCCSVEARPNLLSGYLSSLLLVGMERGAQHVRYLVEGISHAPGQILPSLLSTRGGDLQRLDGELVRVEGEIPVVLDTRGGFASPLWLPEQAPIVDGKISSDRAYDRALLESVAFGVALLESEMSPLMPHSREPLLTVGGFSASDLLCSMIAELTGRAVMRSSCSDAGALGAAMLAARGCGLNVKPSITISPAPSVDYGARGELRARYMRWQELVRRFRDDHR